jgi:hypothetical protein
VSPSLSLSLVDADDVVINLDAAASASVQGGAISLDATTGGNKVTMIATSGQASFSGSDTQGDISFVGEDDNALIYAENGANVRMDGSFYRALLDSGAIGTAYGSTIQCEAYAVSRVEYPLNDQEAHVQSGSCLGRGTYQTLIAQSGGYAEAMTSANNFVSVAEFGQGLVAGSLNYAVAESGGTVQVSDRASAVISGGADATIYESVSEVTVSSAGTATMCMSNEPSRY